MGIVSRIAAGLGIVSKAAPSEQAANAGFPPTIGTPSATGLLISQSTVLAVSAVYACITIRAQDVARCAPCLWRRDATGKRIEASDHKLAQVFRRPNLVQTWFEFMEQMQIGYLLRGNAYAVIKRGSLYQPAGLIPINPDGVSVMESVSGDVFYNVSRAGLWQLAQLAEFPPMIEAGDVLHLRGLSFNALVGASTITLARDSIGLAMGLEQQSARMMANGARPSMVLQSDKRVDRTMAERLGQQFRDAFAGIKNTGGIPILEDGLKANPLQLTSVDMEFVEQRKFQIADIARFYRMPLHKIGIGEPGANRVQADQDYVSNTIMPDLERWEQKLDHVFGLSEQGLEIDLDETRLLRADVATRYNAHRIGLLSGFVSPNEVRESEGLPPVEGGDEVFRPLNMAALGSDATGTAPDGAGHPRDDEGGVPGADNVPTRRALNPSSPCGKIDGDEREAKAYNPRQPRDRSGKWGSSGLGGIDVAAPAISVINFVLGLNLAAGAAYVPAKIHSKLKRKRPEQYNFIVKNLNKTLRRPDYVGIDEVHLGHINLVRVINGDQHHALLVSIDAARHKSGKYTVLTAYSYRDSKIASRVAKGTLKAIKKGT